MKKSCIVIGGHGFVGQGIVQEAQALGFEVLVAGRDTYDAFKGQPCDVLINANGNSRKFLARQDPALDFDLSVRSVQRSLTDFTARHYVFLSSIDVYPNVSDPAANNEEVAIQSDLLSPYGFHKYLAEQLVRYHRPDALILRMGGFVGPGLWKNPIFDLLTGAELRVHPDSAFQYLQTRDLGQILFALLAAQPRGGIFNVAGDGLVILRELADRIPQSPLPAAANELEVQRYDICIDKLKQQVEVPRSQDTVNTFIHEVLEGRVPLGKKDAAR